MVKFTYGTLKPGDGTWEISFSGQMPPAMKSSASSPQPDEPEEPPDGEEAG